jgi:hypothetical protein
MNQAIIRRMDKRSRNGKNLNAEPASKGMPCVLCGKLWDTCPDNIGDVRAAWAAYKGLKLIGAI